MLDLGTLRIGIQADSSKAQGELKKFQSEVGNAEAASKKSSADIAAATETVSGAFGKVVGVVKVAATAATAAFAATATAALKGYASYEQNIGGINKLFGTAGQSIEEYAASVGKSVDDVRGEYDALSQAALQVRDDASNAWRDVGVSANQYMEQVTSFSASLITSLGGDTAKAAEYAHTAMVDMADNANTFGTSMTDIQNAYQGFAKQNYTMLDNLKLGYGGTKEEMERLIADANRVKSANGEMANLSIDSFADVVEAIHTMQEEMSIAGTTQKEALSTIEGSLNAAKAAWQNWLTGLGDSEADMSQLTGNLVESVAAVAANVAPRIAQIFQALIAEIPNLFSSLKAMLPQQVQGIIDVFAALTPAIAGIVAGISAIFAGMQIQSAIAKITGLFQSLWVVLAANPILAVVGVVAALVAAFATAYATNEDFRNSVNEVFGSLLETVQPAIDGIVAAFTAFGTTLMANVQPFLAALQQTFTTLGNVLLPVLTTAFNVLAPIITMVATEFMNFASTVVAAVMPVLTQIIDAFNQFVTFITPLVQTALAAIQAVFAAVFPYVQGVVQSAFGIIQSVVQTVMGVIQGVITTVMSVISGDWSGAWGGIQQIASSIWGGIQGVVSSGIGLVSNVIGGVMASITSLWNSAWSAISSFLGGVWSGIQSAVSSGINGVVGFFSGLPGRILGALGNVGSLLVGAGNSIIDGLLSGLKSAFKGVQDFVGGIAGWIAEHKGPKAYDLKLLIPNGSWIMESLATGLEKSIPLIKDALDETAREISGYDFGVAAVDASFDAYQRTRATSRDASTRAVPGTTTSIIVNNYSPKALSEKESAREFKRSARQLALA